MNTPQDLTFGYNLPVKKDYILWMMCIELKNASHKDPDDLSALKFSRGVSKVELCTSKRRLFLVMENKSCSLSVIKLNHSFLSGTNLYCLSATNLYIFLFRCAGSVFRKP